MKKFLLLSLFLSALYVRAAVVPVSGTETIADAVSSAVVGDIIELSEAVTYVGNVTIDKSLTLRAAEGLESAPIIQGKLSIKDGATIRGIVFDGASEVADAIRIDDTVTGAPVVISGCTVRNYTNRFVYVSLSGKIESLTIDDCIFIGADNSTTNKAIYASSAHTQVETLSVTNSTFLNFNTGSNYFFRINCGEELVLMPVVLIDHCTFYNCYDRRGVYLYNAGRSTIKNCISAFSERRDDTKSFTAYGDESIVKNVISYNVDLYGSAPKENIISKNPLFVDAENGNFQLYKDSPAVGAGDDGSDLGDPRWGVSTENAPVGELPYECFKKPYSMSPTTHSVRILWQTLDSNPSGTVYYGKTPDLGQKVTAETGWNVDGEGFVHVIELTGLEPFTEYYYQVGDESRRYETICTAKTAPEKGTDFRLVAFSDVHDNDEKIWQNSAPIMLGVDPDMWITIGDLVNKGDMRTWNSAFFIPGESMLTAKTLTSVIGNHETMDKSDENGPTTYYDYFSVPSHGYIDTDERIDPRGESYFAMDYGDVKIIGCNWNEGKDDPSFATGSKQLTWLDEQLTNADSKWIFIFAHVNVYSTSYMGSGRPAKRNI
ncbi:fibronectin type III domain-containing protein [Barnesiella intestinihominis]|uniref:fibronectin type III domain-containing protein n=1 Tax=Barnesiella intestinihominis TaxID=487174 RepID=UPI003AABDB8B